MKNEFLFEVDESVERALREESLDGKKSLLDDLRGGTHARAVIAEMNHVNALRAAGEQAFDTHNDFEFRLDGVLHGNGFHAIAMQEGTYDVWDTEQSDRLDWIKRRFPENRIKHRSQRAMILVGNKYGPPRL
jgi:hypothetical protein